MKKRVYCSDVDGTLARQGYYLTEDTLALVHEMVDADINFTIVTGRFLSRSLPVMQQLKLKVPAFCLSGALAYDETVSIFRLPSSPSSGRTSIFG